jgi:carbonic anhydrase
MHPHLAHGISRFQRGHFRRHRHTYQALARQGQQPERLFIACADSRILPSALTSAKPGDMFQLRNVGNMVPPHGSECAATGSAIEYALNVLNVREIVVCGHSHCGACAALLDGKAPDGLHLTGEWLEQGRPVRDLIVSSLEREDLNMHEALKEKEHRAHLLTALEKAMVVQHLRNLRSYPEIDRRLRDGRLTIHGWHYNIESGAVEHYDPERLVFAPIRPAPKEPLLRRALAACW